jgi:hypothetical protein
MYNLPLNIKKVFLSFIQQYYATEDPRLTWNVDKRLTKIFIGDKYIAAPEVVEKMPSIVLSRGTMTWAQTSIDQRLMTDLPMSSGGVDPNKIRTDLVRASVTFQCVSQNGVEAESLANVLFMLLVGYKDQLRKNGIHQILNITMGEEVLIRSDVAPRLTAVPVNVTFTVQASMATTLDLYLIKVLVDDRFTPYAEGTLWGEDPYRTVLYGRVHRDWFSYEISGSNMHFNEPPPSGAVIDVTYTGRYTLTQYNHIAPAGLINGLNKHYTLPEDVYTGYYVVSGFVIDPLDVDPYTEYNYS